MDETEKHLQALSQNQRDELAGLVEFIIDSDHVAAMKRISDAEKSMPSGYRFSHYSVKSLGGMKNSPDVDSALSAINESLDSPYLEVLAVYKPEKTWIPEPGSLHFCSVLYLNQEQHAAFLDGEEIFGKINGHALKLSLFLHRVNPEKLG